MNNTIYVIYFFNFLMIWRRVSLRLLSASRASSTSSASAKEALAGGGPQEAHNAVHDRPRQGDGPHRKHERHPAPSVRHDGYAEAVRNLAVTASAFARHGLATLMRRRFMVAWMSRPTQPGVCSG